MPHDDAFETSKDAANLQLVEHAINLAYSLACVLNEKYQPLVGPIQAIVVTPRHTA